MFENAFRALEDVGGLSFLTTQEKRYSGLLVRNNPWGVKPDPTALDKSREILYWLMSRRSKKFDVTFDTLLVIDPDEPCMKFRSPATARRLRTTRDGGTRLARPRMATHGQRFHR